MHPWLFSIVLNTLSNQTDLGCPKELLYADYLTRLNDFLEDFQAKLKAWKEGLSEKGIWINVKDGQEWQGHNPPVFPANICWSSRRLQDMPRRRLQHVFSATIFCLPRRLEDVLRTCLEDMSWRHLQDVLETKKWGYLYLTNLNVCVSNKSIFHKSVSDKSKPNPKSLIKTQ